MKKLKKLRRMVATILIASLIFPTHLPSIADVIENEEEIETSIDTTRESNISIESDASNEDDAEILSDIKYIDGEKLPDEVIEENDNSLVYFGKTTVELNEGDNSIYYLPVYRTGDLSKPEKIKIRTLDIASLYGKDYELLGDNITEYVSEMTLLERSLKGDYTNKMVKKNFTYDKNTGEITYNGEEEIDVDKLSKASISEIIEDGLTDDNEEELISDEDIASVSEVDYDENNTETETSITETTALEETEVSPETEPSVEESTTYEEEKEEDETTTEVPIESAEETENATSITETNESIEDETVETESINSENVDNAEKENDINIDATSNDNIETENTTENKEDNISENSDMTEKAETSAEIEETSEKEVESEEEIEESSEEATDETDTTNETSIEESTDETISGFTGTKYLLNTEINESSESSNSSNLSTANESEEIDDRNNDADNAENIEDTEVAGDTNVSDTTNVANEVDIVEDANNNDTTDSTDTTDTTEITDVTDNIEDPIVVPEEDIIYIEQDKDVNFIMDNTGDSIGKSKLALEKERQTGEPTRVTERTLAGSLTEAIMSKLTPEVMQHMIYSAEQEIVFLEGEDTAYIKFRLLDDDKSEGSEMFTIMIADTEVSDTIINVMSINIEDDEEAVKSKISFDKKSYTIKDGQVNLKLKREDAEYAMVSVNVDTIDSTTKIETTHGMVLFAPYEMEREITLNLINDTEIKLSEYSGSEAGKIVEVKAKKTLIDKLFNKNANVLTADLNAHPGYTRNININGVTYLIKAGKNEPTGTIYDTRYSPALEVGKFFTMARTSEGGMWDYFYWGYDTDNKDHWFTRDSSAEGDLLNTHAHFYWYNWKCWNKGGSGGNIDVKNSKIDAIYYRSLFPEWRQTSSFGGGQKSIVTYSHYDNRYYRSIRNVSRGGKFANYEVDSGNGAKILNTTYTPENERINNKIKMQIGAEDDTKWMTPMTDTWVRGIVAMYKKFRIETTQGTTLNFKTGLNGDNHTYASQDLLPASFTAKCGAQDIIEGQHDTRYLYANLNSDMSNMVFTLKPNKVNDHSDIFGTIKGYNVKVAWRNAHEQQSNFVYPDDFVNFLKDGSRISNTVLDYSTTAVNNEIDKIYNNISTVTFDKYFLDFIEHNQKAVCTDNADYSNAYYQDLQFQPIYEYNNVKLKIIEPTGLEQGVVGGRFRDTNLVAGQTFTTVYHAGDRLDLHVEAAPGYREEGYEVSTDGGRNFDTIRSTKYLVLLPNKEYIIRPAVSKDFNRIEFVFPNGYNPDDFVNTIPLIPQSDINTYIEAHPQFEFYRGRYFYDCNPGAGDLTIRATPKYGFVYDFNFEAKKKNESDNPIVLFTDKMLKKTYQGPTLYYVPRSIPTDNVIEVKTISVDSSEKRKHKINGNIVIKAAAIRNDGEGIRSMPLEKYFIYFNEQGYGSTTDIGGLKHKRTSYLTDENGYFETGEIEFVGGYAMSLLVDDGGGNSDIVEFTPAKAFDDTKTESTGMIEMGYSNLIPKISSLTYDYDSPYSRDKTDFSLNTVRIFDDNFLLEAVVDIPIEDTVDTSPRKTAHERIEKVIFTLRHSDGRPANQYIGEKVATNSNLYRAKIRNMLNNIATGDYLTAKLVDVNKKTAVFGGTTEQVDIIYPEIKTGLIFYVENEIVRPKTIDFLLTSNELKYDIPLLGTTNPAANSGTISFDRIDWPQGLGYSLTLNANLLFKDDMSWSSEDKKNALDKFKAEVDEVTANARKANEEAKLSDDNKSADEVLSDVARDKSIDSMDDSQSFSEDLMKKKDASSKNEKTKLDNGKALISFETMFILDLDYIHDPVTNEYLCAGMAVTVGGIFNVSKTFYGMVGSIPCYINLSGKIQASILMGGTFNGVRDAISRGDFDRYSGNIVDRFKGDKFQTEFNLILMGKLQAGVGMYGVLGARGFVQADMRFQFLTYNRSEKNKWWGVVLGISGGIGLDLFIASIDFPVVTLKKGFGNLSNIKEVSFLGGWVRKNNNSQNGGSPVLGSSYNNLHSSEEATNHKYNLGTSDFSSFGVSNIDNFDFYDDYDYLDESDEENFYKKNNRLGAIPYETNRKVITSLLANAAERTRPKIINIDDDHKFLVFIGQNIENNGDASRLYYSIGTKQPGTTNEYNWSTPQAVDTDDINGSTFDSQPDLYMFRDNNNRPFIGVAWIDANKKIDNLSDFKQKLNSFRISCRLYNVEAGHFTTAVNINKGNYFYQNPKLTLYENKLICTFYIRDISNARTIEDLSDISGFYSTVAYSIINIDSEYLVASENGSDKLVNIEHERIQDPLVVDYPTIGIPIDNNGITEFYLVSAYIIDEDIDQTTDNDREIYLSIAKLDEPNNKFVSYYPIRLTNNSLSECSLKLTEFKNNILLSWISEGKDFNVTNVTNIISELLVKKDKGNADDGWRLSLKNEYLAKDKTQPNWYKLTIYDFEEMDDAKEDPSDDSELDPRILLFENSIYKYLSNENICKVSKRIKNNNDDSVGINEYDLVSDGKDIYIFYTDFSGKTNETGKELYGMRYGNPDLGIESTVASPSCGISDAVMITAYDRVIDEIDMEMTSDKKIDLVSNFYKQEVINDKMEYGDNQLVWLYFEPAGSLEVDKDSIKISDDLYAGANADIGFDVINNGLMEASGYNLKVEAVKADRPDLLGNVFVKRAGSTAETGTFSGEIEIFNGHIDEKIDIAKSATKHFNWSIPMLFNLENYYIRFTVSETAPTGETIIERSNLVYKKINYNSRLKVDNFTVELEEKDFLISADIKNIGNRASSNYKLVLSNHPDINSNENKITYNEINCAGLAPGEEYKYTYQFTPKPSDFDEYGRVKLKLSALINNEVQNEAYYTYSTGRPMFVYINDGATQLSLNRGATSTLNVNVAPWGEIVGTPSFVSHNGSIATVDDKGKVVAVSQGSTLIEVYYPHHGLTDVIKVEVRENSHHGGGGGGGGGGSNLISGPGELPLNVTYVDGQYAWAKNEKGNWIIVANGEIVKNSWARVDLENNDGTIKGSNWYHLDSDGSMHVGWYQDTDGRYYFMETYEDNSMGTMLTGWRNVGEKYYYFIDDKANPYYGALLVNTITPDGRYVDGNGEFKGSFFD